MKILSKSEKEEREYLLEVSKIKMDYAKHGSMIISLILGGQITLIGTAFKKNPDIEYAGYSILLMVFACLIMFSISENVIRQLNAQFANASVKKKNKVLNAENVKAILFGLCFIASIWLYSIYALQKNVLNFW